MRGEERVEQSVDIGVAFAEHSRAVFHFALVHTQNWAEAEDVMSLTFFEAQRKQPRSTVESGSILPWLLGVAKKVMKNQSRARRRYEVFLAKTQLDEGTTAEQDALEDRLEAEARAAQLFALAKNLSPGERDVLVLCTMQELGYEEAAVALKIPVGTVRSRLSRAKAKLRAVELSDMPPEHAGGGGRP